jgi:hypothetical protein
LEQWSDGPVTPREMKINLRTYQQEYMLDRLVEAYVRIAPDFHRVEPGGDEWFWSKEAHANQLLSGSYMNAMYCVKDSPKYKNTRIKVAEYLANMEKKIRLFENVWEHDVHHVVEITKPYKNVIFLL